MHATFKAFQVSEIILFFNANINNKSNSANFIIVISNRPLPLIKQTNKQNKIKTKQKQTKHNTTNKLNKYKNKNKKKYDDTSWSS